MLSLHLLRVVNFETRVFAVAHIIPRHRLFQAARSVQITASISLAKRVYLSWREMHRRTPHGISQASSLLELMCKLMHTFFVGSSERAW